MAVRSMPPFTPPATMTMVAVMKTTWSAKESPPWAMPVNSSAIFASKPENRATAA
jgi:hypothetical protein